MKKIVSLVLILILIFPSTIHAEEFEEALPEYYIPIVMAAKNCGATVSQTDMLIHINYKNKNYVFSADTNTITDDEATNQPLKKNIITKDGSLYAYYDDISFLFGQESGLYKNTRKEIISLIYAYIYTNDIPGITMSFVDTDNKYTWSQGFGYADVENKVPVKPSTIFDLGSISKSITAMAVMKLAEEGSLNLDTPVKEYIKDFKIKQHPVYGGSSDAVTSRMLLSHFSGITEELYHDFFSYEDYSKTFLNTLPEKLKEQYMEATPGKRFNYSNTGYALLGVLVSRASGEDRDYFNGFSKYAKTILNEIGMSRSGFIKGDSVKYNSARPYVTAEGGAQKYVFTNNLPAAGFFSNAQDMSKFMTLCLAKGKINGKQVLSEDSINAMISPSGFSDKLNAFETYGLGMEHTSYGIRTFVGHSGDIDYYNSVYKLSYDNNVGVFLAANSGSSGDAVDGISNQILEKSIDEKTGKKNDFFFVNAKPPQDRFLSVDKIQRYLGTYLGIGDVSLNGKNEIVFSSFGTTFSQRETGGFGTDNFFVIYFDTIDAIDVMLGSAYGEKKVYSQKLDVRAAEADFYKSWAGNYKAVNGNVNSFGVIDSIALDTQNNLPVISINPRLDNAVSKAYIRKINDGQYYILGIGQGSGQVLELKNGFIEYAGQKFIKA